jgi:hypothetical protein
VAAVPSGLSLTPLRIITIKNFNDHVTVYVTLPDDDDDDAS